MTTALSFVLATRPKTLPASIGPLAVGLSLSYSASGQFSFLIALSAMLTALSLQIAVNLFNDVLDFQKGADTIDRLGPKRVTQSGLFTPLQVTLFGALFLALSFVTAIPLIMKGGTPILVMGVISAFAAYIYTGGPFPLAYHGLGEVFVLIFFGFGAVLSLYYVETGEITASAFLAALQVGLYVTAIITMNNMRDIEEDTRSKKMTLAVRLGQNKFQYVIAFCLMAPYVLGVFWLPVKPLSFFLPLLLMPFSFAFLRTVLKTEPSRIYNYFLGITALLQLTFAMLLSLSFLL